MRPSRDETLIEIAEVMAKRGTCSRAQVGVVIAREGRILSTGYNGTPAGMPHCEHLLAFTLGATANGCMDAVHAEANAIAYAARYGISLQDSTLYTTLTPCNACAQIIINAGVERLVYLNEYRDNTGLLLLSSAGILINNFRMTEDLG